MQNTTTEYIEKNRGRFVAELQEYLRFPSVSAQTVHRYDVVNCANWLAEHFASLGLEAKVIETAGNPIVWARLKGDPAKRVIVYGHYDIQPEEPLEKWNTPPFEPIVKDNVIYARGAMDNKGQLFAHAKGIEALIKTGNKPAGEVIFLVEGEEESTGDALAQYIKANRGHLAAYAVVISDGTLYKDDPAIGYGLRGVVPLEIIVKGPNRDMHSGSFGGAVPNPASALAYIIPRCVDENGTVLIPGFYDDIHLSSDWEKENFKKLAFDENKFKKDLGIKAIWGNSLASPLEKMWCLPTFEVNGIYGGYMGQGGKTIIPSYAGAKITMRTVPHQDAAHIAKIAADHIKKVCPEYVDMEIKSDKAGANPVLFDLDNPAIRAGAAALKTGFGKDPVYIREGGSIPVVEAFYSQLKCPVLLMGFGGEMDNAHSPNEHFSLDNFFKGIKTSAALLSSL